MWDTDQRYWWRGFNDPVIAMDTATWLSAFARHPSVNQAARGMDALSFVRRTLITRSQDETLCGFDGSGPVSLWYEGAAQYIAAGGEDAQAFLDMLILQQNPDGSMPGSPENISSTFGWLITWSGLAPTAWLYFAVTGTLPFPAGFYPISDVPFVDPALQQCVQGTAYLYGWERVGEVTYLVCINEGISSLKGVEYFTNLIGLIMPDNQISDLNPLTTINDIQGVNLENNLVTDLIPLTNKNSLTTLWMTGNLISDVTSLNAMINLETVSLALNPVVNISSLLNHLQLSGFQIVAFNGNNEILCSQLDQLELLLNSDVLYHPNICDPGIL